MRRARSNVFIFRLGVKRFGFRGMGVFVIGELGVGDGEDGGGRLIGLQGKFAVKPEGADLRRVLVTSAVGGKGFVGNGDEIVGGFAAKAAELESVFADCAFGFKAEVLKDNGVVQHSRRF